MSEATQAPAGYRFMFIKYRTDGTKVEWTQDELPTTEQLQKEVGGYLELYHGGLEEFQDDIYCDEEARMKEDTQPNPFFPTYYGDFVRVMMVPMNEPLIPPNLTIQQ